MVKIQSNTDRSFLMNGVPYQKGAYEISPLSNETQIKIVRVGSDTVVQEAPLTEWVDGADAPFASFAAFVSYTEPFFFRSVSGGGGSPSPLTTKGDLYTFTTADARLGVGTNGSVLIADSTQSTGLKWESNTTHVYQAALISANWVLDAGDIYYQDIPHNLNTENIGIEVYDTTTKETVIVHKLQRTSANNLRLFVQGNTLNLNVVIWDAIFGIQAESRPTVKDPITPYTPTNGQIILWDCTAGNKVLNLPAAATALNYRIDIKKIDNSINTITVDPSGTEQIEGGLTAVLTTQYESISIVCDGTAWWVLAAI